VRWRGSGANLPSSCLLVLESLLAPPRPSTANTGSMWTSGTLQAAASIQLWSQSSEPAERKIRRGRGAIGGCTKKITNSSNHMCELHTLASCARASGTDRCRISHRRFEINVPLLSTCGENGPSLSRLGRQMLSGTTPIFCIINANLVAYRFSERSKAGYTSSAYRVLVWIPQFQWSMFYIDDLHAETSTPWPPSNCRQYSCVLIWARLKLGPRAS